MKNFKRISALALASAVVAIAILVARASPPTATSPATAPNNPTPVKNAAGEIVVEFPSAPGKPLAEWTGAGVTFSLASAPEHSRAQGRIMFFPHLKTKRHGILNAMADEQAISVKAQIKGGASSVTVVLWGTVGCHAWLEAYDKDGKRLTQAALPDVVPQRTSPSDPIPSFDLTVKADNIAYITFGGAPNGSALVADEMRYVPAK